MAQPPGSDTRASPQRAASGPSTSTEARMVFTSSYGAVGSPMRFAVELDAELLVHRDRDAHLREQGQHGGHVAQVRHVGDHERLVGQQRRGEYRQRGVLGAGNIDLAGKRRAALDLQLIHAAHPGAQAKQTPLATETHGRARKIETKEKHAQSFRLYRVVVVLIPYVSV